jgi:integrase/recombinase XerD
LLRVHHLPVFSTKTLKEADMNPEHVSVEDRRVQTRFLGTPFTQHPLVCPPWTSSPTVLEDSHELRRKQKIIGRTLEKITDRGLCGFEPLKGYLSELYRRNCRPNTLRTHAATILSFLVYLKQCGQARLEGIDRGDIGGFVEHEQDRRLTACTIATRLRGLYSFLRFMVQRGELSPAVLTGKLRIKLPESLPRAIDPQSVRQLLGVIDHVRDRAIVLVLLRTGMRIGELLDTRLRDVDLNEQKIEIMEAQKTRVGRVVYLSEDACAVLRKWLVHRSAKSDYLFHGLGRPRLGYEAIRSRFDRYLGQAGLSEAGYSLHSLRHTYASELLNAGMRLECLQQLLGHSCIEMTRRYARLTDTTRREEYFRAMALIEKGEPHGHY